MTGHGWTARSDASSGGPLLNDTGAVIGVVVSGIGDGKSHINSAIPVNHLTAFLTAPDVSLIAPDLTTATAGTPQSFRAKVVSVGAKLVDPKVRLVLRAGDDKPREISLTEVDGVWNATAVPLPVAGSRPLELSARFGMASITRMVADRLLTANGKPFKLGQVRKYESAPKPIITLADGAVLDGPVVDSGRSRSRLDLSSTCAVFRVNRG